MFESDYMKEMYALAAGNPLVGEKRTRQLAATAFCEVMERKGYSDYWWGFGVRTQCVIRDREKVCFELSERGVERKPGAELEVVVAETLLGALYTISKERLDESATEWIGKAKVQVMNELKDKGKAKEVGMTVKSMSVQGVPHDVAAIYDPYKAEQEKYEARVAEEIKAKKEEEDMRVWMEKVRQCTHIRRTGECPGKWGLRAQGEPMPPFEREHCPTVCPASLVADRIDREETKSKEDFDKEVAKHKGEVYNPYTKRWSWGIRYV